MGNIPASQNSSNYGGPSSSQRLNSGAPSCVLTRSLPMGLWLFILVIDLVMWWLWIEFTASGFKGESRPYLTFDRTERKTHDQNEFQQSS
jgi:hypothetical protein